MRSAGIVLCGGKSRRMGRPKELLPFGPETLLQRVVRLVGEAVEALVVVASAGQELPELAPGVRVVRDHQPDRGPLEAIRTGLVALRNEPGHAEAAFVCACDVPLLVPALVRRMIELAAGFDVALPHVAGRDQPLCAVYRTSTLAQIETLLAADRLRPAFLFDQVRTRRVTADELAEVDPNLASLANVNTPAEYSAALAQAGLESPPETPG